MNRIRYLSYCLCLASNYLYNINSFNKMLNNTYSQQDLKKEIANTAIDANVKNFYDKEILKTLNNLIN